jgi:hypothetical protein
MKSFHAVAFIVLAVLLCSTGVAEAGKRKCAEDIAGSAANGGLRLAAYRIACARMAIGCPMRASED